MKLLTFLLFCAQLNAALLMTAAGTDKVDHGSAASLDDLSAISVCVWIRPTTLTATNSPTIWSKDQSAGGYVTYWRMNDASGNMRFRVQTSGGVSGAVASTSNPLAVNVWSFACVSQAAAGVASNMRMYHGGLSTSITEVSGSPGSDLTVAKAADASTSMLIGGFSTAGSFSGRVAWAGVWNRVLTLGEMQTQQFQPRITSGCVLFSYYGFNGTGTQADRSDSSNNGTVTGSAVADHVPTIAPFSLIFDVKKLILGWMKVPVWLS